MLLQLFDEFCLMIDFLIFFVSHSLDLANQLLLFWYHSLWSVNSVFLYLQLKHLGHNIVVCLGQFLLRFLKLSLELSLLLLLFFEFVVRLYCLYDMPIYLPLKSSSKILLQLLKLLLKLFYLILFFWQNGFVVFFLLLDQLFWLIKWPRFKDRHKVLVALRFCDFGWVFVDERCVFLNGLLFLFLLLFNN